MLSITYIAKNGKIDDNVRTVSCVLFGIVGLIAMFA